MPSPTIVNVNVQRCRIWTTLLNVFPMLKISTGRQFCQHRQSLTSPTAGHRHGGHRQPVQLDLRLHHRQRGVLRGVGYWRVSRSGEFLHRQTDLLITLILQAASRNICVAVQEKVPSNADEGKFRSIITNLLVKSARAIILFTRADDARFVKSFRFIGNNI